MIKKNIHRTLICLALMAPLLGMVIVPECPAQSNEDELFLVAQKAFDDGFYDVAIRYIDQFLEKYPQSQRFVQAQLLLGQCHFFQSHYLKAYETFHQLLEYQEFKDATMFWLGETYFKGSDYKQAEKYYLLLMEAYPDSIYVPQAYYSLAWTFFEQTKYDKAKENFLKLVKRFPAHRLTEDAVFKLGECEQNKGQFETAVQYFQQYLFRYPNSARHADAYFYIGEAYYYLEDYLTAVTYYAKAADLGYDKKLVYMSKVSMGWSYLKLEKFDLAKKYFDDALELSTKNNLISDDIYLGRASLFAQTGENKLALEEYSRLLDEFPHSPRIPEARLGKANVEYVLKQFSQAIADYQWLIDTYASDESRQDVLEKAYYGLAWTHLKAGDIDDSIKSFEQIMNTTTSKTVKISALTQIGDAYHDIEQYNKAIEVYDRILNNYPDSIYLDYVQFRQAVALLRSDRFEAAALSFQSLEANFPVSKYLAEAQYYLGVTFFKKEDWRQASRYSISYLQSTSSNLQFGPEALYIQASSHFNLKEHEKAYEAFGEILKTFPQRTDMIKTCELYAAQCLYRMEKMDEALAHFDKIIAKYPESEAAQDAFIWMGDHYLETAQWPQAIEKYLAFLERYPSSPKAALVRYELGQAYEAQGDVKLALEQYKEISQENDKLIYAKAKLAVADIFSKETDFLTAIDTYRNISDQVPEFKRDALVKVASLLKQNRMFKDSKQAYQEALQTDRSLSSVHDAELQFSLADNHELLNQKEQAVETYLKIPYLYPAETSWIIKAYLRTARIFEEAEKWQEARTIYSKITDFEAEEKKHALERIDWIDHNINLNKE